MAFQEHDLHSPKSRAVHGEAARVPREAMVSATLRASQSLLADGAQVEMGAARAEGDGAT